MPTNQEGHGTMVNKYFLTRWDALKIIALLLMFIDHAGHFYLHNELWLRAIGRTCAPIFFFLSGFAPHYRFNTRLMLFAVILTALDWGMQNQISTLNILFTIILGRAILGWLERHNSNPLKLHEWVIGCIALSTSVFITQYGSLGFLFMLAGFIYRHKSQYQQNTPSRFLIVVTLIYAIAVCVLGNYEISRWFIVGVGFVLINALLRWFAREPTGQLPCGPYVAKALLPLSWYTAEIYAGHIIILILLTGHKL
jgi:hypothetical protein